MRSSIVITGPESSGKTTLLRALRSFFEGIFIPEYSRIYLSNKDIKVQFHHVLKIAEGQLELYDKAIASEAPAIISDTDLLVLQVWSDLKFPQFRFDNFYKWKSRPIDLYLLCSPDIPWEPDKLREDPENRYQIFDIYESYLKRAGKNYAIISGEKEDRIKTARRHIEELLT